MSLSLSFLGGVGTVTGSKFLLENDDRKILVDCGLFQGLKQLRLRNWAPFPIKPEAIDAVLLTHAHLDHSGYLPALVRDGFSGKIHCSHATAELCGILLPDSGFLPEKDAEYANRHGFPKHKPALPLYTLKNAEAVLPHLSTMPFHEQRALSSGPRVHLRRAGHILGAATVDLRRSAPRSDGPARSARPDHQSRDRPRWNGHHPGIRGRASPISSLPSKSSERRRAVAQRANLP